MAASARTHIEEAGLARAIVAHVACVPMADLYGGTRRRSSAVARQVAMYLLHVTFGVSFTEVARAFGRHPATARHACDRIARLRQDPGVDRRFARLEGLLREAAGVESRSQ
jgi:chromosomal replication initiation ATPase DnaA